MTRPTLLWRGTTHRRWRRRLGWLDKAYLQQLNLRFVRWLYLVRRAEHETEKKQQVQYQGSDGGHRAQPAFARTLPRTHMKDARPRRGRQRRTEHDPRRIGGTMGSRFVRRWQGHVASVAASDAIPHDAQGWRAAP